LDFRNNSYVIKTPIFDARVNKTVQCHKDFVVPSRRDPQPGQIKTCFCRPASAEEQIPPLPGALAGVLDPPLGSLIRRQQHQLTGRHHPLSSGDVTDPAISAAISAGLDASERGMSATGTVATVKDVVAEMHQWGTEGFGRDVVLAKLHDAGLVSDAVFEKIVKANQLKNE
jgi:hypothetical protein